MYDNLTYETILQRVLARVSNKYDKREGSIIYDATAPAVLEIRQMYIELDNVYKEMFADTQSREYLIKRAEERGLTPYPATKSIVVGTFTPTTLEIPIGSRFGYENLTFVVISKVVNGTYRLECETAGIGGNLTSGLLLPIDSINGLQTANITDIEIYGTDEEDTETFRNRYKKSLSSEAFGGNKADYKAKAKSQNGVGGVKVYTGKDWNGGGTVKLVIQSSNYEVPSDYLIETIQNTFDPVEGQGEGNGLSPAGHFVSVVPVDKTTIDITINITYLDGYNWSLVKASVEQAIDNYLLELNESWENTKNLIVRIAQIESRVLNIEGITDVGNTTINGRAENLQLDKDAIAVRGSINE